MFIWIAIIICGVYGISQETSQAEDFDLSGYYKNFNVVLNQREALRSPGAPDISAMSVNRLRLRIDWSVTSDLAFHGAYSIAPRIQDEGLYGGESFIAGPAPRSYRGADLEHRLYPESQPSGSFALFHNLDRAYMSLALPFADLYLGRQAIAWGSARVINPTDIIAPYTFEELDTEERIGVDAFRMRIPLGFMSELDFGYVAGNEFTPKNSALFLRGKTYIAQTDLSLMLVYFREHIMTGLNAGRAVGGAGVWLEAAYVLADPFDRGFLGSTTNDYFRGTAGLDYSLSSKAYGFIEVHYSTAGVERNQEYYFNALQHPAYSDGATYLLGQKYVIPGLSYQLTPLISLNSQIVYNVDDGSTFFGPTLEYNISQNIYLGGGAFLGIGPGPERPTQGGDYILLNSEFGSYPNLFYTNFRVYF